MRAYATSLVLIVMFFVGVVVIIYHHWVCVTSRGALLVCFAKTSSKKGRRI